MPIEALFLQKKSYRQPNHAAAKSCGSLKTNRRFRFHRKAEPQATNIANTMARQYKIVAVFKMIPHHDAVEHSYRFHPNFMQWHCFRLPHRQTFDLTQTSNRLLPTVETV